MSFELYFEKTPGTRTYIYDICVESFVPSIKGIKKTSVALDGSTCSVAHRVEKRYQITANVFGQDEFNAWDDFVTHAVTGAHFGIINSQQSIMSKPFVHQVVLDSDPSWSRAGELENDWTVSFTVRVLP